LAIAQFEEKEYELQFSLELAQGRLGTVWGAGQVLEGIVGYDGVADPDVESVVWQVLKIPRPKGVVLSPSLWQRGARPTAVDLSSRPVTLVLQYKRPDFLHGARAAQWHLWHRPYFRFGRASRQHSILARLEMKLAGSAVVRYAAPAFWTRADLEAHASAGSVIEASGFVSPSALGRHSVWTYVRPGIEGVANPSGRVAQFESASAIRELISSPLKKGEPRALARADNYVFELARHLGSLAEYRQPRLRDGIRAFAKNLLATKLELTDGAKFSIIALAAFSTLLWTLGASWYLAKKNSFQVGEGETVRSTSA
jgi:hypothetical protein